MPKAVRVAVVGVGHLGSRHAETYAGMPGVSLAAVCDKDAKRAEEISQLTRSQCVTDYRDLFGRVDAVSLVVPTSLHASIGIDLLRAGIHLLVEKPIASSLAQADGLIREAQHRKRVLQVGHIERFNAAIRTALKHLRHPRFIEVHRLSPYPFRGTDVSVILDVMIHDLDLILAIVRSHVTRLDAIGVAVLSKSEDLANARLKFASGCVANLTASRISDETIRRIRVFQEDRYLSIDYKAQTVELARIEGAAIKRVDLPVSRAEPLQEELASFVASVRTGSAPAVSGEEGRRALALALRIEKTIRRGSRKWSVTSD